MFVFCTNYTVEFSIRIRTTINSRATYKEITLTRDI